MGARPHGRQGGAREARELAADQGEGRIRPAGQRRRGGRREPAQRRQRPRYGDDWLHEIKFDGYRILARLARGKVTLLSRNGLDWTRKFPEIAAAVAALAVDNAVLDGEIVAL